MTETRYSGEAWGEKKMYKWMWKKKVYDVGKKKKCIIERKCVKRESCFHDAGIKWIEKKSEGKRKWRQRENQNGM